MDVGDSPILGLVIFVICILIESIVSGFVAAIENIGDSKLNKLEEEYPKKIKQIQLYHDKKNLYVHILQMVTVITAGINSILQMKLWMPVWNPTSLPESIIAAIVIFIVVTIVFLILGVYVPWIVWERKPEQMLLRFSGVFRFYHILFKPLLLITSGGSHIIAKLFGVDPSIDMDDVTEEEIISMVNEGHEQGVLLASEAAMIQKIFEFGDKDAKDIMIHRKNIIAMEGNMTFAEAISFMNDNHNSRYPVYLENLDNIIGIIHIKEALAFVEQHQDMNVQIRDIEGLIRLAEFVPETHGINTLFTKMQSEKNHMVIVMDEYGQTSGIISMEDILEEIVGNIQDEHDDEEDTIEKVNEDDFIMEGRTSLDEVSEILDISFEDEEVETLNGFLISKIDKIPQDHEIFRIEAKGYEFIVLDVENKMIQEVRVKKLPQSDGNLESEHEK